MIELILLILTSLFDKEELTSEEKQVQERNRKIRRLASYHGGFDFAVGLYSDVQYHDEFYPPFEDEYRELIDIALFFKDGRAYWLADESELSIKDGMTMLQVKREDGILKL